jgi:hypothetical protein
MRPGPRRLGADRRAMLRTCQRNPSKMARKLPQNRGTRSAAVGRGNRGTLLHCFLALQRMTIGKPDPESSDGMKALGFCFISLERPSPVIGVSMFQPMAGLHLGGRVTSDDRRTGSRHRLRRSRPFHAKVAKSSGNSRGQDATASKLCLPSRIDSQKRQSLT